MIGVALDILDYKLMFHVKHELVKSEEKQSVFHVKHELQNIASSSWNLLLAGGRMPDIDWLEKTAKTVCPAGVYCADRGASYALSAKLNPILLVGDGDSASMEVYEEAKKLGAKIDMHPPAKDDTDLQLLLGQIPLGNLVASGIWGGRFDHLFSNIFSLLAYKQKNNNRVVLVDHEEVLILLTAGEEVSLELENMNKIHALSLLPLSPRSCVSIDGVKWSLQKAELTQMRPYAISNVPLGKIICCTCHSGALGLYIHWQK